MDFDLDVEVGGFCVYDSSTGKLMGVDHAEHRLMFFVKARYLDEENSSLKNLDVKTNDMGYRYFEFEKNWRASFPTPVLQAGDHPGDLPLGRVVKLKDLGFTDGFQSDPKVCGVISLPLDKRLVGSLGPLATFSFPELGDQEKEIADMIFWRGRYRDAAKLKVSKGTEDVGSVVIKTDGSNISVLVSCVPIKIKCDTFHYHEEGLAKVALGKGNEKPPTRPKGFVLMHAGSGSCPPVQGP